MSKNKTIKLTLISKKDVGSYGTNSLKLAGEFIARFLRHNCSNVQSNAVTAIDGNDIDQIVTQYNSDIIIIEALWVTPSKLKELIDLHPNRKWVVRVHSKIEFLAQDGIAFEWLNDYDPRCILAFNSKKTAQSFQQYFKSIQASKKIEHLPNIYYPTTEEQSVKSVSDRTDIRIGVFGALRELKNNLNQIIAAINYANERGKIAYIYINDVGEEEIRKNITAISDRSKGNFQIIPISWLSHSDFLTLVSTMDVGLQVSFSESYNIVSFDFIYMGVPIIISTFMECTGKRSKSPPDEISIRKSISKALRWHCIKGRLNKRSLYRINKSHSAQWLSFVKS